MEKGGGVKSLLFCGIFCKNGELLLSNSFVFYQSGGFTHKKDRSGKRGLTRSGKGGAGKWLRFALVLGLFCRWGDWMRGGRAAAKPMPEQWKPGAAGKSGKANAATAGSQGGKANGSALREAGREAGKTKRVNSAGGWTADKSGKNDKRSRGNGAHWGGGCTAAKERQKAEETGRRGIINDLVKK